MYAIIKDGKIYRVTFSKSLARHIIETVPGYQLKRMQIRLGKRLEPGEKSSTGLYALATSKCGNILRVQLDAQVSEALCDNDTRYIAECWGRLL